MPDGGDVNKHTMDQYLLYRSFFFPEKKKFDLKKFSVFRRGVREIIKQIIYK